MGNLWQYFEKSRRWCVFFLSFLNIAILNVAILNVAILNVAILNVAILNIVILNIAILNIDILNIAILNIAILNIVILNIVKKYYNYRIYALLWMLQLLVETIFNRYFSAKFFFYLIGMQISTFLSIISITRYLRGEKSSNSCKFRANNCYKSNIFVITQWVKEQLFPKY